MSLPPGVHLTHLLRKHEGRGVLVAGDTDGAASELLGRLPSYCEEGAWVVIPEIRSSRQALCVISSSRLGMRYASSIHAKSPMDALARFASLAGLSDHEARSIFPIIITKGAGLEFGVEEVHS